jgi:hypothetical protein
MKKKLKPAPKTHKYVMLNCNEEIVNGRTYTQAQALKMYNNYKLTGRNPPYRIGRVVTVKIVSKPQPESTEQ